MLQWLHADPSMWQSNKTHGNGNPQQPGEEEEGNLQQPGEEEEGKGTAAKGRCGRELGRWITPFRQTSSLMHVLADPSASRLC